MNIFDLLRNKGLIESYGVSFNEIEQYQKKLYNAGVANIPLDYAKFLTKINGIQTDTLSLFGIGQKNSFVRGIFEENSIAGTTSRDELFLGDNFTEYLIYDWQKKSYLIIDKITHKQLKIFPFLQDTLEYFLREYL